MTSTQSGWKTKIDHYFDPAPMATETVPNRLLGGTTKGSRNAGSGRS